MHASESTHAFAEIPGRTEMESLRNPALRQRRISRNGPRDGDRSACLYRPRTGLISHLRTVNVKDLPMPKPTQLMIQEIDREILSRIQFVLLLFACLVLALPSNAAESGARIVIMAVEDPNNYDAVNSMRDFADGELRELGHQVDLLEGNQALPTDFPGLVPAVREADLLIVFVRRATLPAAQLDAIRKHLAAGKPLLGIRTANHGFVPPRSSPITDPQLAAWPEFTPEVLGGQNTGYETEAMPYAVSRHPQAPENSLLLDGVNPERIRGYQSLYKVLPLAEDATPLLLGTADGHPPAQPLAWTRRYGDKQARIFYTSLGAPQDMQQKDVRRLLVNAVHWTLKGDKPDSAPPASGAVSQPFEKSDWNVRCWDSDKRLWTDRGVDTMTIVPWEKGATRITNTSGIHKHAHLVFPAKLEGDFTFTVELKGGYELGWLNRAGKDEMLYVEMDDDESTGKFETFELSRSGTRYTIKHNGRIRPMVHFRFDYGDDVLITLAIKQGESVEIKSCSLSLNSGK
jgi:hypothetical protein